MTFTLEDYLVKLHTGSWFTWTDFNNRVYANLILTPIMNNAAGEEIANPYSLPSEADCTTGVAELQADYDAKTYARSREAEYPTIEECVHAILDDDLAALQVKRQAVKDKYPKE
jgi:hypothetical protein